ncbi:HigA family addiction module antitoxin [Rhizobium sp. RU20A]|uniref:HigA family addiction module antitoxin n=1 Tax=Rhizobium sp. RU20A TaxID=1907412 RepID=UPI00122C219F|nr:HigA family addiction module antitoxin [Rhizobium sp. RU20A]
MNAPKTAPASPCSHPGAFVRLQIIQPRGLTVKDAAQALGIHRVALSRFLNEQAALSSEMAIRLEKAFGADMESLMRMQNEFDIAQAKLKFQSVQVAGAHGSVGKPDMKRPFDLSRSRKSHPNLGSS